MTKIFIAGAGGYIGSKMVPYFLEKGYKVIALDRFYFGDTLSDFKKNKNLIIVKDDIRTFKKTLLKNCDAIINLASISNDPSSDLDPKTTYQVNYKGAVRLAKLGKEMGVKKYIFSSSCSVYGESEETANENSKTNPLTIYAKSKLLAEKDLLKLADDKFTVTILRLATVFGLSKKRMRFDLIVNIMTLHAWKNKKIFIMGGGKQWRPLIHIDDVVSAFEKITTIDEATKINKKIFNVGNNKQVYQVKQVANMFTKFFPDLIIEKAPDDPDHRDYKVTFEKILKELDYKTEKDIEFGISEIKQALEKGEITDELRTNTLWFYQYLIEAEKLLNKVKHKGKLF